MQADSASYIVDAPLPLALDFQQLKAEAIAQLQQQAGQAWTNFNDSDPGITILEQLCYALTELGYCAQMPIQDVLTGADGSIRYAGQFFAPQDILTTAPVTTDDYRKLIHDRVAQVRAVYLQPQTWALNDKPAQRVGNGRYAVYVAFRRDDETQEAIGDLLNTIDFLLHQQRNLGEFFYFPVVLAEQPIRLKGKVYLNADTQWALVVQKLTEVLREYAAPTPLRSGFGQLQTAGLSSDAIMNGPRMENGWISAPGALPEKRNQVSCAQIASLLTQLDGVTAVESLSFAGSSSGNAIDIADDALAAFEFLDGLQFIQNKQVLSPAAGKLNALSSRSVGVITQLQVAHAAAGIEAKVDVYPPLPQGRYRDIESYISIQSTFPEMYGIGPNSLESDAPDYRVASARQLKAYLLVYDQLLANEFSQLAHLGDLFSFAAPRTRLTRPVLEGALPEGSFSTTYFCQNLYDVPDVKPLLRGNQSFHYQFDHRLPPEQVAALAWQRYQQFPFNEYMHGLRECMEQPGTANVRRDQFLTHLMARHGEDAQAYDAMMSAFQSYGSPLETRIIVKSIWMQNIQLLSYHRMKACNWRSPTQWLQPGDARLTPEQNWWPMPPVPPQAPSAAYPWWQGDAYPAQDGELDQARLFEATALAHDAQRDDLQDVASFECKLAILLGLPSYFLQLAGKLSGLLATPAFLDWLDAGAVDSLFYSPELDVSVGRVSAQEDRLFDGLVTLQALQDGATDVMQIICNVEAIDMPSRRHVYEAHAAQLLWLVRQRPGGLLLEHQLLFVGASPQQIAPELPAALRRCAHWPAVLMAASLLLPGYVSIVAGQDLNNYLDSLRDLHWPCHLDLQVKKPAFARLTDLITHYVDWHNAAPGEEREQQAQQLLHLLDLPSDAGGAV
jgi:hypothetical protein